MILFLFTDVLYLWLPFSDFLIDYNCFDDVCFLSLVILISFNLTPSFIVGKSE